MGGWEILVMLVLAVPTLIFAIAIIALPFQVMYIRSVLEECRDELRVIADAVDKKRAAARLVDKRK